MKIITAGDIALSHCIPLFLASAEIKKQMWQSTIISTSVWYYFF